MACETLRSVPASFMTLSLTSVPCLATRPPQSPFSSPLIFSLSFKHVKFVSGLWHFCICCSLCLERSYPSSSHNWFPHLDPSSKLFVPRNPIHHMECSSTPTPPVTIYHITIHLFLYSNYQCLMIFLLVCVYFSQLESKFHENQSCTPDTKKSLNKN